MFIMNRDNPVGLAISKQQKALTIRCCRMMPFCRRSCVTRSINGPGGVAWKMRGPDKGGGRFSPF
jgi:hypothetical protein